MATFRLRVAGIGYDGAPAGTGGETFTADDTGTEADKVFYKVSSGGGIRGALRQLMSEKARVAYLDPSERSSLDSIGVTYRTESEVLGAGMSHYILWLDEDRSRR